MLASVLVGGFTFVGFLTSCKTSEVKPAEKYEASWESLKQHSTPEWFKDAKFGIYFHCGAYSVPAYRDEWYPRGMYAAFSDEDKQKRYHREHFGNPSEFGYKDFIPMFKAEKFDADEWAELFKKAGAKFAGPVPEHHDGFAMWDSEHTEWDAADIGPKRDITGELARAVKNQGMKFITSFHHAYNWKYYETSYEGNYDTKDPRYAGKDGLYPEPHEPGAPESEEFLKDWEAKVREVIDKYEPDFLWFDMGWGESTFEEYKKSLLAYYGSTRIRVGKS